MSEAVETFDVETKNGAVTDKVSESEVSQLLEDDSASSNVDRSVEVGQIELKDDDDVLTAIYKDNAIEIVAREKELSDSLERNQSREVNENKEDISKNIETIPLSELIIEDSEIDTEELDSDQAKSKQNKGEFIQDVKEDKISEKELQRSDSKETSPFLFPEPLPSLEAKKENPAKPQNPLAKLLNPSPPTKQQTITKKHSHSAQNLLNKTRTQNLSTESLQNSRIPRASVHLGRSVSMFTPPVSNPVPPKGDKTPIKRPAQKIPHLIHAQRRPGGVLKRSVSMHIPKKMSTEMAEGMTLVLAVPVTHTAQSVHRSSGDGSQPFIISPYQEEHVLAATCPVSGITRHIKIIL